jgi:hypothetical protein
VAREVAARAGDVKPMGLIGSEYIGVDCVLRVEPCGLAGGEAQSSFAWKVWGQWL